MKIQYVSTLCSDRLSAELRQEAAGAGFGFAVHKFNRLTARGLAANGSELHTLSSIPAVAEKRRIRRESREREAGVEFQYIPLVNIPVIKDIYCICHAFFKTLAWGIGGRKEKRVVFDVLNVGVCLGALTACRLIGLKTAGIVTDMPEMMVGRGKTLKGRLAAKITKRYITAFDSYILLTEAMDEMVNSRRRPYIVMEGLCEKPNPALLYGEPREKSVIYAGGLYERYGVKNLIDGFMLTTDPDASLELYGNGDLEDYIAEASLKDPRIHFHGVRPNEEILQKERIGKVLVNPRPSTEEFTRFSFPSKNMEYMASGTPVLTTPLPGMPSEYRPYVYLIEEETPEGIAAGISKMIAIPDSETCRRGRLASEFVGRYKNHICQTRKILDLLERL